MTPTPAETHQQYFPGEPLLMLQGHVVPRELYRPVQMLVAEIERLRASLAYADSLVEQAVAEPQRGLIGKGANDV